MSEQYADAEVISIIEGPMPEFRQPVETWTFSLREEARPTLIAYCQMRTLSGPRLLERCQNAWGEGRPVKLDFPDKMGLRYQADIVAARWTEVEEGHLLHLWVRLPKQIQPEDGDGFSIA